MTRPTPPRSPSNPERAATETRVVTEPGFDNDDDDDDDDDDDLEPPARLPRATMDDPPRHAAISRAAGRSSFAGEPSRLPSATGVPPSQPARTEPRPRRPSKLPYVRHEIVGHIDENSHLPSRLPRSLAESSPAHAAIGRLEPVAPGNRASASVTSASSASPSTASPSIATSPPAITPASPTSPPATSLAKPTLPPATSLADLASLPAGPEPGTGRVRARGTPGGDIAPGEQIRTLIFAPEPTRAAWIERELAHAPITIQVGRRIRTVVAALVRDPPPRPQVLVVDFDAVSAAELVELHTIRQEGWPGRLIGLGNVWPELRASLRIDEVLAPPLVRDSLLDCVAGTRHAAVTTACPVIPQLDDPKSRR